MKIYARSQKIFNFRIITKFDEKKNFFVTNAYIFSRGIFN